MAERQGTDKYIHCSTCKKKFINDYDHIKVDFRYNGLNVRFKCCVQCRARAHAYTQSEKGIEARAISYENIGRGYNYEKLTCATCGASVCRNIKRRHEREKGCVFDTV